MPAELELGLDQVLERCEAELLEPADLGLCERFIGEIRQRRAAPQREPELHCLGCALRAAPGELSPSLLNEPLETAGVDTLWIDLKLVAMLARDEKLRAARVPKRLAEPRHSDLNRLRGAGGRTVAPQLVGQALRREGLVGVDQQQAEQRSLPVTRERDSAALVEDLERAEEAEVHPSILT